MAWYSSASTDCIATVHDIETISTQNKITLHTICSRKTATQKYWAKNNDTLILYTYKKDIQVGDRLYIHALKSTPPTPDLKPKFLQQNIAATSFQAKNIKIIKRPPFSLKYYLHNLRTSIKNNLKKKLSPLAHAIFLPIFLGKKERDEFFTRNDFNIWGIVHYMARSGLHVMLIFIIITMGTSLFAIPQHLKNILVLLICLLYHLLTWPSTSFIRALIIIICYQLCKLLKIPINTLHLLHIALLMCLISNPFILFALDFQLTFALTYALIFANKPLFKKSKNS